MSSQPSSILIWWINSNLIRPSITIYDYYLLASRNEFPLEIFELYLNWTNKLSNPRLRLVCVCDEKFGELSDKIESELSALVWAYFDGLKLNLQMRQKSQTRLQSLIFAKFSQVFLKFSPKLFGYLMNVFFEFFCIYNFMLFDGRTA